MVRPGENLQLSASAVDNENHQLFYTLLQNPSGMSIDQDSGRIRRITAAFLYQGSLPVAGFAGIIWLPDHLTVALAGFELNLPPSAQFHPLQLSSDSKPPGSPSLGCGM